MMKQLILISLILASFNSFSQIDTEADIDFEILKHLELFEMVYKNVDLFYVDEPNPGELMKTGIDAMLAELDPYTNYIPESKMEDYKMMTTGQYGGIGAIIRLVDEKVTVVEPQEKFPAHKAGMLAGDVFIEIDGKNVEDLSSAQISEKLKGQPGKALEITISRQGELKSFSLVREEVKMSPVPYYGIVGKNTGYIKLTSFTQSSAKDVQDAFIDLKNTYQIDHLIFDLRGNGGGLLNQAVHMVNYFVEKGSDIVEIKGRMAGVNQSFNARNKPLDLKIPIVILVDGASASASEVVSGALQDLDRAVIVGQTSFGKGLVQQPLDLKYNAKIKVTIAKYYTPSGRCIQKLDYSNKEFGANAEAISEETLNKFKTKNGRTVIDGRGVEPDVIVEIPEYSRLAATLFFENVFFNYATDYRAKYSEIPEQFPFTLSKEMYNAFKIYVISKNIDYSNVSSEVMTSLRETAEEEGLYKGSEEVYDQLMAYYKPDISKDLDRYKTEIADILEDEIIGRYYFQTGRLQHGLATDPYILEALKILNDQERYNSILNIQN